MSIIELTLHSLMLVALGLGLFALGHALLAVLLRPARVIDELFRKDNAAMGVAVAGYHLGLVISFGSVLMGASRGWIADLLHILSYGPAAVVVFFTCGLVAKYLLIGKLGMVRELTHDRNLGMAFVLAGYLIASGLLIHGVLLGEGGNLLVSLAFFAIAQVFLILVGPVYGKVSGVNLRRQILEDNAAVGLAYCGCLMGLGAVLGQLLSGDFVGWGPSLRGFLFYGFGSLLVLPMVRWLADLILAPGVKLTHEIASTTERPNLAAGTIEAVSYIAAGLIVAWSVS